MAHSAQNPESIALEFSKYLVTYVESAKECTIHNAILDTFFNMRTTNILVYRFCLLEDVSNLMKNIQIQKCKTCYCKNAFHWHSDSCCSAAHNLMSASI